VKYKTIALVPIKLVLKKFLELPNVFASIVKYIDECKNNTTLLIRFIMAKCETLQDYKRMNFFYQLQYFFDDFKINNPLGSRKSFHKLGAVYFSLLGLPPEYSSNFDNILLMLHNYQDHKKLGKNLFTCC
jgi:hypothetical protein